MQIPWDGFLALYRPLARNLAVGILRRGNDADDVIQEAMLALIAAHAEDARRFQSQQHARNYFLKTVRNLALRKAQRESRVQPLSPQAVELAREDPEPAPSMRIPDLLAELDMEERRYLEDRFLQRQTLAQIAERTGTALSTLHDRERALLARLRRRFSDRT